MSTVPPLIIEEVARGVREVRVDDRRLAGAVRRDAAAGLIDVLVLELAAGADRHAAEARAPRGLIVTLPAARALRVEDAADRERRDALAR